MIFGLPGEELKAEFKLLTYDDLMAVELKKDLQNSVYVVMEFLSKGSFYSTISLEMSLDESQEKRVMIYGAQ